MFNNMVDVDIKDWNIENVIDFNEMVDADEWSESINPLAKRRFI